MSNTATGISIDQFAVSPCSSPKFGLEEALKSYSALGYRKFELFSAWAESRVELGTDPQVYLDLAEKYGMEYTSMHLLPIEDNYEESLEKAIAGAKLAKALGVKVVLYKANSRENYIKGAKDFLDAIDGLGVTPVLQNHVGTPITTADDFKAVIDGIADPRMKTLLEVGMFHSVGVSWQKGYKLLEGSIALVHIKDQIGENRVPFGEGEVDLKGLFEHLGNKGYDGEIVVEMEVCRDDQERTLKLLKEAREHCANLL
ncbi:MAG: sugar phosphate isomerase/epimerase [Planctomycetes bacterium]|nr:sugar phosphate isomerase/epimerase [Planctomycetota bacterium]